MTQRKIDLTQYYVTGNTLVRLRHKSDRASNKVKPATFDPNCNTLNHRIVHATH